MNSRSTKTFASLVAGLLAVVLIQPAAARPVQIPERLEWVNGSSDPAVVMDAIATNAHKLPAEFADRLKHQYDDGTIRVMVALSARDDSIEAFARQNTSWLRWYGNSPRFLGRINPDQLATLLTSSVVDFVEPDYRITNFMSTSSLDVHARSLANDGTGVWSYKAVAGTLGELVSDVPGLTVEQATGAGVTVAITDSGIDRTHRDFGGWACKPGPYQPCDSRITKTVSVDHVVDTGLDPSDSLPTSELASGHGTHVAGTVAGNAFYTRKAGADPARYGGDGHNFGIAPQADLISLKNGDTLWAGLSGFALQWTLDNADEYGIKVSSNSWGCLGGCSFNGNSATGRLFRDLYNAGVVVVFAAGNDGGTSSGSKLSGNSQSPYVLGVANYNDENDRLASSSSRGEGTAPLPDPTTWTPESEPVNGYRRPDVAAPGTTIWSARTLTGGAASGVPRAWIGDADLGTGGTVPYVTMSGTSMATPHVAGAAALLSGACQNAGPLHVMRAIMVGADETEVKSTDGTRVAEPYEVGYGALEVRAALDWLRGQTVCGGTAGEPTPTESPTGGPTASPTESPTEPSACTGQSSTNYLHSEQGFGHLDWVEGTTTFNGNAPTREDYSEFYDVWFQNNGTSVQGNGPYDPYWEGAVSQPFDSLTVDFWAKTPQGQALGELHFNVAVYVDTTKYVFPMISKEVSPAITNVPARVTATFDKLANGDPFLIDPTGKNVTITIYGQFLVDDGFPSIVYDSKEYPSSFTVTKCGAGDPTATPTEEPGATSQLVFTPDSDTSGQYSDEATFESRLTDEASGAPIEGAEIVFELVGAGSTWTTTTNADGVASTTVPLESAPGSYFLTARYSGDGETRLGDAEETSFIIDKEDSAISLQLSSKNKDSKGSLKATLTDADGPALAGHTVEFFADGVSLGTATTDARGVAVMELPSKYRGGHRKYETSFAGDDYYLGSTASQQT